MEEERSKRSFDVAIIKLFEKIRKIFQFNFLTTMIFINLKEKLRIKDNERKISEKVCLETSEVNYGTS